MKVEGLYTPEETKEIDPEKDIGAPGAFPFTRGVYPTMYRGRPWTMRQYAGFGTAEETNRRFRFLLDHGQTGLSVAFDLPTQMGLDSDHPMARGEVGRTGVAIDSIDDMETLFKGIPLGQVSTSMTINATAGILLALYQVVAERQGVPPEKLNGTIQNDVLKEYIARGTYIYPPQGSLRIITDIFAYCRDVLPQWNAISVSGYHMREAGCTAIQEVSFTLANGVAYLEAARGAGVDPSSIVSQVSFFFGVHNDFLEEIAKFRAARRLWARLIEERFGCEGRLRFHVQTAGCSLTAQQPRNNIIRVALQCLAAVLGGAQSIHTNSFDEALALPTEESARLALRTQQIIAHESGVINTVDPCGGAYALEALTAKIEEGALRYIGKVDEMGGMVKAIERGYVQQEIQNAAYTYQKEIETKARIVVGVNDFQLEREPPPKILKMGLEHESKQRERLQVFKKKRDASKVNNCLETLSEAAHGSDNLMRLIVEAVRHRATLGEISGALGNVFGKYRESVVI